MDGHGNFILKPKKCKDGKIRMLKVKTSKRSKNSIKTQKLLQREYQNISNKKKDLANKIVHKFSQYDTVVIQDEQLSKWQKSDHGKAISQSCLGTSFFLLEMF
jgi:uncharacterized membrane protein YgaE (UPF0421/DUF939 family)